MIIIDNLNPILDDNFIKWGLSEHVASLLYGIVALGLGVYSRRAIHAKVKVDANLPLVLLLVVGMNIWHLHLLEVDGIISQPVIFLEVFGFTKLLASPCVGIVPCHFHGNIHVYVWIVIGRPKTYRIQAIRLRTQRSFFILTLGLNILTVILNVLNSTSDTHTSKGHLFGVDERDLEGHWSYFIAVLDWACRWVGVLLR